MAQIYDMQPTALLPFWRKAYWGFFRPKNPTASAGFEPANLGTKGQHATPRPPKPICTVISIIIILRNKLFADNVIIGTEAASFNTIVTFVGIQHGKTDREIKCKELCWPFVCHGSAELPRWHVAGEDMRRPVWVCNIQPEASCHWFHPYQSGPSSIQKQR